MTRTIRATLMAGLFASVLGACSTLNIPEWAVMPRTQAGTPVLSDVGAIQYSAYTLGVPSRTAGKPDQAALALVSVEYLAGALYRNPHWYAFPAQTKILMLQGRDEIRNVLAIPPAVPSQVVINDLVAASNALSIGDTANAEKALPPNVFTLGPQRTIAFLTNMPYLPQANVAAQQANADITFGCISGSASCG